jgi:ribosome maturation factor RimP
MEPLYGVFLWLKFFKMTLKALLISAINALEYEYWGHVMIKQGKHSLLRFYIDAPEGVNVEDCAKVSHQINGMLAVEGDAFIRGDYTLEVSSPGLDRPLFFLSQYEKYRGSIVKLRLKTPQEGQRHFQGTIEKVVGNEIVIALKEKRMSVIFQFDEIERGNIVPDFGEGGGK